MQGPRSVRLIGAIFSDFTWATQHYAAWSLQNEALEELYSTTEYRLGDRSMALFRNTSVEMKSSKSNFRLKIDVHYTKYETWTLVFARNIDHQEDTYLGVLTRCSAQVVHKKLTGATRRIYAIPEATADLNIFERTASTQPLNPNTDIRRVKLAVRKCAWTYFGGGAAQLERGSIVASLAPLPKGDFDSSVWKSRRRPKFCATNGNFALRSVGRRES